MRKSVILAMGAGLALATALPVHALDVSASVGGVGADVSAGGGGISADVSTGGAGGANASADVGGRSTGGVGADVNASLGGGRGVNADVNAGLGGGRGVNAGANARIGAETMLGVTIGAGGAATGGAAGPGVVSATPVSQYFAGSSAEEQARMKRSCRMVLGNPETYERDLTDLCRIISRL
jgi:hypothetical protein